VTIRATGIHIARFKGAWAEAGVAPLLQPKDGGLVQIKTFTFLLSQYKQNI
jgi:hypothetical protein